jgi:hypothetical protein
MKRTLAAVCAAVFLLVAVYLASPLLGYYRMQSAARGGDQDALEATIDFPAVRENLKSQLNAGFAAHMQSDAKLKDNPFAGLGMMLATAVIGKLVDSYLTPEAISMMVLKAKAPDPSKPAGALERARETKIDTHYSYINLDRFRVTAVDPKNSDKPLSFVMERRGFMTWKLIRIELPATLFR